MKRSKMKAIIIGRALLFTGCFILISTVLFAESVKLSTYYPAPFGAYDRLKLVPRDSLADDPHCNDQKDVGTMYYDNGLNELTKGLHICQPKSNETFAWDTVGIPSITGDGPLESGKVVCIKESGALGACASSPSFDGTCACM